jgi:crotonobetainyl-CoA:carnitine CoA-transferase CaiB-like acyl-CoA transferase
MLESTVVEYEKCGFVREPTGPRLPRIAPSNVYESKDGKWVVIAANHDTLWRRLAKLMGREELAEDERFANHRARGENEDLLDELIGAFAARHTAEELDRIVNEAGVVCARVYSAEDIYADPYFRERGLLVDHEDEVHGRMTVPGVVPKLSRTPGGIRTAARWTVGADTDAVLRELETPPESGRGGDDQHVTHSVRRLPD